MTAASGSALPGDLALEWMDPFGDNLYNIYGSTEVAYASIATPRRPARGADLGRQAALGDRGEDPRRRRAASVPQGETGRIFVGNGMLFEGYTGGGVQGGRRRADVVGRRRPLRRERPPLRRGPRRRDDRLRRRERLPAGGRGLPGPPRGGGRGRRDRRRRRRSSASGCGPSSCATTPGRPRTSSRTGSSENLARYKVPREIVFLDELPRNATGKVLKRELAETTTPMTRATPGRQSSGDLTGSATPAPDFTLRDQFGQDVTLSSYRRAARPSLLVFYPWAFSGVCTGEMSGIRDRLDEFLTFDTEVLAISCDPIVLPAGLRRRRRPQLPAALATSGRTARWRRPTASSTSGGAAPRRSSFVVDRDGIVRWAVHNATAGRPRPGRAPRRSSTQRHWPRSKVRVLAILPIGLVSRSGWHSFPVEPLVTRDASGSTLSGPFEPASAHGHGRGSRAGVTAPVLCAPGRIAQR